MSINVRHGEGPVAFDRFRKGKVVFKKVSDVPDSELLECVGLWAEDGPVLGIIYHLCVRRRLLWMSDPTGKWDEELAHPLGGVVLRPDLGVRAWMPDGTPVPPQ